MSVPIAPGVAAASGDAGISGVRRMSDDSGLAGVPGGSDALAELGAGDLKLAGVAVVDGRLTLAAET